jgi:hypothetical protein
MKTDYRACEYCKVRIIIAKGVPPLNWGTDPAGSVAAQRTASGAWIARFLAKNEQPIVPEKRYTVHDCPATQRAKQRADWQAAVAAVHRHQRTRRTRRAEPQITGVIIQPPTLPGINPGKDPS